MLKVDFIVFGLLLFTTFAFATESRPAQFRAKYHIAKCQFSRITQATTCDDGSYGFVAENILPRDPSCEDSAGEIPCYESLKVIAERDGISFTFNLDVAASGTKTIIVDACIGPTKEGFECVRAAPGSSRYFGGIATKYLGDLVLIYTPILEQQ